MVEAAEAGGLGTGQGGMVQGQGGLGERFMDMDVKRSLILGEKPRTPPEERRILEYNDLTGGGGVGILDDMDEF